MSFWQSNSQPDLSVTGTSTSRHQRPPSGRRVRPSSAGRGGSTKSHIFGIADTPRQDAPKQTTGNSFHDNSAASSSVHTTPEAPRPLSGNQLKKTTGPVSTCNVRRSINIYRENSFQLSSQEMKSKQLECLITTNIYYKQRQEPSYNWFLFCILLRRWQPIIEHNKA